jgi:RAC serine/threonine-protein kinase
MEEPVIVKQGWLLKRGEYIKNWRPRWFQLKSDGSFRGYKTGPPAPTDPPINIFDVAGSVLSLVEDKKTKVKKGESQKFGFMMRFMQMTRFVERSFHTESEEERKEWMDSYEQVQRDLSAQAAVQGATDAVAGVSVGAPEVDLNPKKYTITDFEMMKVLGKGTFGKVMLSKEKATGELYAIKVLKKDVILAKDEVSHTLTENAVLQSTKHPFLTGLKCSFQTPELLVFVMEYVNGGELFFHLSREKIFSEDRCRFYIAQISMAITYLHDRGIIYRDLKLENLLLDSKGNIKITDFGLCKEEITFGATTTTFCGTPEYLAPEVLEDNDYGRAVDWWGVGVVMYEMICGHLPFYNRNHEVLFDLILHEEIRLPATLGSSAKDLLSNMLNKDPRFRLGGGERDGREVMEHPFFFQIDFEKLYNLEIPAPFIPKISGADDVSNFDTVFTSEVAEVSPIEGSAADGAAGGNFNKFEE